ncbi:ATP-binding cassette domain-containing protein [Dyella psychrodurans]|uniref:ABC transporter ATP-binding protein n=1 Tax=Dyella psychrodurans TaxID=1927960 RepID=A0A370X0X0_9GAMM|nr:ABC transporter ATP-binding protein [Dyella psychrodurans]RDS81930.1 ABC transporter ATP-binding protein [Dyella psychrodurans]
MSGHAPLPDEPLRAFASTLKSVGVAGIAVYVLLSLGSALVGSLAAVLVLPLVQPGHALPIGNGLFDVQGGTDLHAAVFAGATIAFALLRWQAARQGARLAGRYGMHLRRSVHARLIDAPLASLADATSAEIANVLTYNIEIITQGFNALLQLLVAGVTAVVSVAFALWVSPPLVLATPLLAGLGLVASRISSREQAQVSRQYVSDLTRLFWLSEDFPRRLRHVRSFEKEQAEKESYGDISERLRHGYQRQLYLIASGRLMLELLAAVGIAAIFVLAYRLHGVDQASLIAVCLLLGRLLPYLVSTRQSFQQLRAAVPAFELWQRYMHRHPSSSSCVPSHRVVAEDVLHIGRVRLMPPLDTLDIGELALAPGKLTLVSGDSGIGKSSLVDVLAGMAKPKEFVARIGARSIDFDAYCELVRRGAYVSQSVRPWQRSIRECLLWAAPDATDDMLMSVLEDVGLARRLAETHRNLDSAIDNASSKLSGGELQRLLLAQVILRQPRLALLDEATSALDVASEIKVLSKLRQRLPQTILIVVSHRPDVMAIADQRIAIGQDRNVAA